jgi:AcrR family transcriptional regulator
MGKPKIVSDEMLAKAREEYMNFIPVTEIAKAMGINHRTLWNHVRNKKWKEAREAFASELLSEISANKKAQLTKISGLTANVLIKSLEALNGRTEPLSIREAKDASSLYETLDKILKLDEGRPTDIIANERPATIIEIQKRLSVDPLHDIKEIEFEGEQDEENNINVNTVRNDESSDSE